MSVIPTRRQTDPTTPSAAQYTVGWICALPSEYSAARLFLDEGYTLPDDLLDDDANIYSAGRIGQLKIIIACCPAGRYGTTSAAGVATEIVRSFPNIKIGLMVGIGGGCPSLGNDIHLGDVVVSVPTGTNTGVLQYDVGTKKQGQSFIRRGALNHPPRILLNAVNGLRSSLDIDDTIDLNGTVESTVARHRVRAKKKFLRPDHSADRLYQPSYIHPGNGRDCASTCDMAMIQERPVRNVEDGEMDPDIHYGLIASGNTLMKDANARDELAAADGVLCFETEAAGLMNDFPCLVVRGICDYCDTHKNDAWQQYAAMTAAAYSYLLLKDMRASRIDAEQSIKHTLSQVREDVGDMKQLATQQMGLARRQMDMSVQQTRRYDKAVLRDWLAPTDPSVDYNHNFGLAYEGTGHWFFKHTVFENWATTLTMTPSSLFWLHGMPGAGKSVLLSQFIDFQIKRDQTVMTYFFFSFADQARQTTEAVKRSLIWQLCSSSAIP